ncbi:hypothetical protein QP980_11565, partial [Corynebacterium coyleae]|uniref:hypothetical protein n=1 Tax=Corynebacterium coyleae TaxID=53374 RepID=UPI003D719429|nr:hypothetical protein [Corynebacterium coyleae]
IRILTWHDSILPDRWVSPSTGIMTPQITVFLLAGGDKSSQDKDIRTAQKLAQQVREEQS